MLDLDKLMNQGIEIRLFEKDITLLQPTAKVAVEIDKIQSEMNEENAYEKRKDITKIMLNNNVEKINFTDEQINKIPVKLQVTIHQEINKFVFDLVNNPN